MKKIRYIITRILLVITIISLYSNCLPSTNSASTNKNSISYQHKKILYIDSYHKGYQWSDGITMGIFSVLDLEYTDTNEILKNINSPDLKIIHLDTKQKNKPEDIDKAVRNAIETIKTWQPDVVITSDDDAAKYIIEPYYLNAKLPFVFCGINWTASDYNLPCTNVTGMIEVSQVDKAIEIARKFTKGYRLGFLSNTMLGSYKDVQYYKDILNIEFDEIKRAKNFIQWKNYYIELQDKVDILLFENNVGIENWDDHEASEMIHASTRAITFSIDEWMAPYTLFTLSKDPEEQGVWAAQKALEILSGKKPADIPVEKNKNIKLTLNLGLAKDNGIIFPIELIRDSQLIGVEPKYILYINSYHKGYSWSDDIEKGLKKALEIPLDSDTNSQNQSGTIELNIFRMNTKINNQPDQIKTQALKAKELIESKHPDLVILSDDFAVKEILYQYYKDSTIPFIFCGVNWDISMYDLPYSNTTGMIEVNPVDKLLELAGPYTNGSKIGIIGYNNYTNQKHTNRLKEILGNKLEKIELINSMDEFKSKYQNIQKQVDLLFLSPLVGIKEYNMETDNPWIINNTVIPTASLSEPNSGITLLAVTNVAEEQGWWAGNSAKKILNGTPIADIPVTANKETKIFLNMILAKKLNIIFPVELIDKATLITE